MHGGAGERQAAMNYESGDEQKPSSHKNGFCSARTIRGGEIYECKPFGALPFNWLMKGQN
jgi:hypothetical protein